LAHPLTLLLIGGCSILFNEVFRFHAHCYEAFYIVQILVNLNRDKEPSPFEVGMGTRNRLLYISAHPQLKSLLNRIWAQVDLCRETALGWKERNKQLFVDTKPVCPAIGFPVQELEILLNGILFPDGADEVLPQWQLGANSLKNLSFAGTIAFVGEKSDAHGYNILSTAHR
jgi:hypothetical protein